MNTEYTPHTTAAFNLIHGFDNGSITAETKLEIDTWHLCCDINVKTFDFLSWFSGFIIIIEFMSRIVSVYLGQSFGFSVLSVCKYQAKTQELHWLN